MPPSLHLKFPSSRGALLKAPEPAHLPTMRRSAQQIAGALFARVWAEAGAAGALRAPASMPQGTGTAAGLHTAAHRVPSLRGAARRPSPPSPARPAPRYSTGVAPPAPHPRSSSAAAASAASGAGGGWARYLLLAPPLIAASLCKWQLDRRQWKIDLLERRQRIMKGQPLDIFSDEMPEPEEYQRVTATGRWEHSRTQFVGPRPRSRMGTTEVGYLIVTPLVEETRVSEGTMSWWFGGGGGTGQAESAGRGAGRAVMVLRGWAPAGWREDPKARAAGEPAGIVTVEGVVRLGEDPGSFVPDNQPHSGAWFYLNAGELAAAAGLPPGTPLVEVVSPEAETRMLNAGPTPMEVLGGRGRLPPAPAEAYPLPKSEGDLGAFSVMPRDHANYAATWATLAAATGAMAARALRRPRR